MGVFDWILYIFIAICSLLFMIMIHEFGHYTAGKLLGFKINEFAIGFGKPIFKKTKKNGEVFSLRLIPLGGFCAFEGEDEDKPNVEGAFNSMPVWKRLIVLFCGAFFNFLSALVFAAIFLMACGYVDKVQVTNVQLPPSVASENWIQEGDIIVAVDGQYCNLVYDKYFTNMVSTFDEGQEFVVKVNRKGKDVDIVVSKQLSSELPNATENGIKMFSVDGLSYSCYITNKEGEGLKVVEFKDNDPSKVVKTYDVGGDNKVTINGRTLTVVASGEAGSETYSLHGAILGVSTTYYKYGFFEALGHTFVFCFQWAWKIILILWQLLSGQLALTSLGGTVTTVITMAEATKANFANLLLLLPLISINLSVFNLLPIPALDGARMVFVAIEGIRGKPINRNVESWIHFIGLIVLFAFVVIVDILHFVL